MIIDGIGKSMNRMIIIGGGVVFMVVLRIIKRRNLTFAKLDSMKLRASGTIFLKTALRFAKETRYAKITVL